VRRRLADLCSFESVRFYKVSDLAESEFFTCTAVCTTRIFMSNEKAPAGECRGPELGVWGLFTSGCLACLHAGVDAGAVLGGFAAVGAADAEAELGVRFALEVDGLT
jgi:hypothetical protein